jgi:hypothetical protein
MHPIGGGRSTKRTRDDHPEVGNGSAGNRITSIPRPYGLPAGPNGAAFEKDSVGMWFMLHRYPPPRGGILQIEGIGRLRVLRLDRPEHEHALNDELFEVAVSRFAL